MGFFLSLIIIVAVQMVLSYVLQAFGMPYLYIEMVTNLVLAFIDNLHVSHNMGLNMVLTI